MQSQGDNMNKRELYKLHLVRLHHALIDAGISTEEYENIFNIVGDISCAAADWLQEGTIETVLQGIEKIDLETRRKWQR